MTQDAEQCCTLKPPPSHYIPIGQEFTLKVEGQKDLQVYTVGPENSPTALIAFCDIFGFHPNTLRCTDLFAKLTGYRIVMPDFFRGDHWPIDNMPPKEGRPFFKNWIRERASWEKTRAALLATVDKVKEDGATALGAYGLCFGAKQLLETGSEPLFQSMAFLHPTFFEIEDADDVRVPIALVPSSGEAKDMIKGFWTKIQEKKDIATQSVKLDFTDMHHGFAAARTNWADPRNAERTRDCYGGLARFFRDTL